MFVWPSSHSLLSKAAGGSRENPFLAGRRTSKTGFSISVCGPGHEISGPDRKIHSVRRGRNLEPLNFTGLDRGLDFRFEAPNNF